MLEPKCQIGLFQTDDVAVTADSLVQLSLSRKIHLFMIIASCAEVVLRYIRKGRDCKTQAIFLLHHLTDLLYLVYQKSIFSSLTFTHLLSQSSCWSVLQKHTIIIITTTTTINNNIMHSVSVTQAFLLGLLAAAPFAFGAPVGDQGLARRDVVSSLVSSGVKACFADSTRV
jgi:hypothetical protein